MPYRIIERDGEYCVEKTTDGEIMGCHANDCLLYTSDAADE